MACQSLSSKSANGTRYVFNPVERDLDIVRKWLLTPMVFVLLLIPVGRPCQISHHYSLNCLQVGMTYDYLSPPVTCIAPSKTSQWGWSSASLPLWFCHALWLKHIVSSAIGLIVKFLITKNNSNTMLWLCRASSGKRHRVYMYFLCLFMRSNLNVSHYID